MTEITETEKKLTSLVQRGLAKVDFSTGSVFENSIPIGRIRKKFIPYRRNLGLKGRFDWEIQELENRTGIYEQSSFSFVPYSGN